MIVRNKFTLKKSDFMKATGLTLIAFIIGLSFYLTSEPTLVQAISAQQSVVVTLNVDTGISITNPGNTTMSTSLGVVSNTAVATSTFTVATNDALGYGLTVAVSTTPALKTAGSDSVPDASATPGLWSVASGASQFGFGVYGTDVNTTTYGTGSTCSATGATSTPSTTLKYRGFAGASTITVASRSSTTTPSGISTTVCYAVGQNNTYVPAGTYTATVTATATAN